MRRLLLAAILLAALTGCERIVVAIPEAAIFRFPPGPRVAMVHVKDPRPASGRLGRLGFEVYDVRPVPADLFMQALRTRLEEEGCLVAEIPDPGGLDEGSLRRFLAAHHFSSILRAEVVALSLSGWDASFGRVTVRGSLRLRVLPVDGGKVVDRVVDARVTRWAGRHFGWDEGGHVTRVAREAVIGTVRAALGDASIRTALGLRPRSEAKKNLKHQVNLARDLRVPG